MGSRLSFPRPNLNSSNTSSSTAGLHAQPSHVTAFEPPRFEANDPLLLAYLQENGYAVVKQVASAEQVNAALDLIWQFLDENTSMKRDDQNTWTDTEFCKIGSCGTGIVNSKGIGQSDFLWYCRLLPKVTEAFHLIHQTKEQMISSFDGGNIFRPWQSLSPASTSISDVDIEMEHVKTNAGWLHVDQGKPIVDPLSYNCLFIMHLYIP